jgi:hypothetical protein
MIVSGTRTEFGTKSAHDRGKQRPSEPETMIVMAFVRILVPKSITITKRAGDQGFFLGQERPGQPAGDHGFSSGRSDAPSRAGDQDVPRAQCSGRRARD